MGRSRGVRFASVRMRAHALLAATALVTFAVAFSVPAIAGTDRDVAPQPGELFAGAVDETAAISNEPLASEVLYTTYPSGQSQRPGGQHPLGVYLPSGWDPDRPDPYPLLVLSHGADGDERSWFEDGRAAAILDAAISEGAMPPSVVVTTLFEELSDAQMLQPGFYEAYAVELRDSVLPFVADLYNAGTSRAERSFGGLSMGGGLGLSLLAGHPDLFARYGIWSAAADLGQSSVSTPTGQELERIRQALVIHMGTGVDDELWNIGALSQERAELYMDLGLPIVRYDIGGGHTWDVWRQQLDHFVRGAAFAESAPEPEPGPPWGRIAALALAVVALASVGVAGGMAGRRRASKT